MLDKFIYGKVNRISPEAPVPVLAIEKEKTMLGGAGNVLANLCSLDASATIVAITGADDEASKISTIIKNMGASTDGLVSRKERKTTLKYRYLAGPNHIMRADVDDLSPISEETEKQIIETASRHIKESHVLVISDYGKGALTEKVINTLIYVASENGLTIIVDPKGKDYTRYKGAHIITPNLKELAETTGMKIDTNEEVILAAQKLIRETSIPAILVTRSQDGMTLVQKEKEPVHIKTKAREIYDVSGAGDTVVATIAASIAAEKDILESAQIANIAAGIVVGKTGTSAINKTELDEALSSGTIRNYQRPGLCKTEEAVEIINSWKKEGLEVGFTNGCFDIIHSGHVSYLEEAARRCDKLVVAINTDASIRRLKGETRPVNDETSRATVLAGLASIDMVVFFGGGKDEKDMPIKIIETLKPDIHFKGGDYTVDQLPEAKTILSYGGKVEIMPLEEGKSTTAIINRAYGK